MESNQKLIELSNKILKSENDQLSIFLSTISDLNNSKLIYYPKSTTVEGNKYHSKQQVVVVPKDYNLELTFEEIFDIYPSTVLETILEITNNE